MRRFIITLAAIANTILATGIGGALAAENVNCDNAPKNEWANCIIQQSIDSNSQ